MPVAFVEQSSELQRAFGRLFPLPLTAFESFMVADNRPDYPMLCDLELHFQGRIDRAAFEAGLRLALARNPLFTSLVVRDGRRGWRWTLTDRQPPVDWAVWGTPIDASYLAPLDLAADIGLRIWVREGLERSTVLLHFHHACSDAIGGFAFIEDLLAGYAMACPGGDAIVPRTLDPARLASRGESESERGLLRRLTDPIVGLREGVRFFRERPMPLAPPLEHTSGREQPMPGEPEAPMRPGFLVADLPQAALLGLRQVAADERVTVNDILLRDMFVVMRRWNEAQGRPPGRRRLRILMPQNLRTRADRAMPAANAMSFAFLTRRADRCRHANDLLRSIAEETDAVRRGQLSRYFLGSLAALDAAGALRHVLNSRFCFATCVLTNLGDPARRFTTRFPRCQTGLVVGNLVFERVAGVPPLRKRTHAAWSISSAAQSLSISLKCDPHSFSRLDVQRLLGEYVAELEATAAAGKASGRPATSSPALEACVAERSACGQ